MLACKLGHHDLQLGLASLSSAGLGYFPDFVDRRWRSSSARKKERNGNKLHVVCSEEVLLTSLRSLYLRLSYFSLSERVNYIHDYEGRCSEEGVWSDSSARTASVSLSYKTALLCLGYLQPLRLPTSEICTSSCLKSVSGAYAQIQRRHMPVARGTELLELAFTSGYHSRHRKVLMYDTKSTLTYVHLRPFSLAMEAHHNCAKMQLNILTLSFVPVCSLHVHAVAELPVLP
jgi:hypothetical protein